jgi:hypothetical protein
MKRFLLAGAVFAATVAPVLAEHNSGKYPCVPAYIRNDISPAFPSTILAVPVTLLNVFATAATSGTILDGNDRLSSLRCTNVAIVASALRSKRDRER